MNMLRRRKMSAAIVGSLLVFAPLLATAQVAWVKDFGTALKQASKEKKFVVLDVSASW